MFVVSVLDENSFFLDEKNIKRFFTLNEKE